MPAIGHRQVLTLCVAVGNPPAARFFDSPIRNSADAVAMDRRAALNLSIIVAH